MDALLFDLGETLIHIDPLYKNIIEESRFKTVQVYLSHFGFNFNSNYIRSTYEEIIESTLDTPEEEVHILQIFIKMLEKLSIDYSLFNLEELEKIFYSVELEAWTLFPDTITCLDKALKSNFKLGVISNARSDWSVREVLRRFNLNKYFEVVVSSAQVGWRKPRPEPFLKALKKLKVNPKLAIFIGDTFSTDILGAKRLGMKAIYLNRDNNQIPVIENIIPDYTVKDLLEAFCTVQKIG